jgi:hypothetical protein
LLFLQVNTAIAKLTALFVAVTLNPWIRALQPLVLSSARSAAKFPSSLFYSSAVDFYRSQVCGIYN